MPSNDEQFDELQVAMTRTLAPYVNAAKCAVAGFASIAVGAAAAARQFEKAGLALERVAEETRALMTPAEQRELDSRRAQGEPAFVVIDGILSRRRNASRRSRIG